MSLPPSSSTGFAPRVTPNVWHAFGGIWRLTVRRLFVPTRWLVLAGLLVLLVLASFPAAPNREAAAEGFLPWAIGFYVTFLVPVMAFISAGGAMRDELKAGTVDYVLTRPLRRPIFVAYKYLAQVGCAQIDFLCALAVVIGIGVYRQVPGVWAAVPMLLLAQAIMIVAFSAFGFLCAVVTSRYVLLGLVYGAIVEVGIGNIPTQLNRLSLTQQVRSMLEPLLGERATSSEFLTVTGQASSGASGVIALALVFALATLALAAGTFAVQELAGAKADET